MKRALFLVALLLAWPAGAALAADRFIVLASTTSTENSGLLADLLPRFRAHSGISVRVVAVGTGGALRLGARGDADVVLVHSRRAELDFVAAGHGVERREVMTNDFVIVGPVGDPARAAGADVLRALRRIVGRPFVSRGDDSGTHKKELGLWRAAGLDPTGGATGAASAAGVWYLESGSGMGATLNLAAAKDAYALADRATWLAFGNRRGLGLLVAGDKRLLNVYGVMLVNPARHPVKAAEGRAFMAWLMSEGQAAIGAFRIKGQQAFWPQEAKTGADLDK
ncbi:MAG TPA: substrate-binding domain-containing protein [Alphaproteobacteria bacterium]|jgi:tungstate transport system substrate-binding protein|nr:substrate-binding domain-containing protein [Alphaproteobacteria bacterium]MDP6269517.1 substrate-binding domain-containing protein [Alphaproteobacteria bacterium]MDP7429529.1 substrate-binding domain-containing protein [Alphaproteobacteria bacterium]HJM49309.1 substrate-binding domain-containing protein [Alphaproteobacteria bacterium]